MRFLDFDLRDRDLDSAARELLDGTNSGNRFFVLTLNALIVHEYLHNEKYRASLKRVNYVVPDGSGILKAVKLLTGKTVSRVPGIELMLKLCENSGRSDFGIYLLGAKEHVVTQTIEKLKERFPIIKVVGSRCGFFDERESDTIVSEINNSLADILFVGMGVPKQEIWLGKHFEDLKVNIAMGVGGSFDVISGNLKRAPNWMQRAGFEWLYRIFQEPRKRLKIIPKLFSFELHVIKSYFRLRRGGSR